MTILEAKGKLFNYFLNKDTFSFEKNFLEVIAITETEELDKAVLEKALEELVNDKIVSKVHSKVPEIGKTNTWWVLSQPLASHSQGVQLSSSVVGEMCDIFAICGEKFGLEPLGFNPFNVQEKDFMNLFVFLNQFFQDVTTEENSEGDFETWKK